MTQSTIEYLKGRVVSAIPRISGDITTHSVITFDNGIIVKGCSVRDINNYDKTEADAAAFNDAVTSLTPGVDFVLNNGTKV